MIPIGDDLPTRRRVWMNYLIITATVATWFLVQGAGSDPMRLAATVCDLGLVPGELTHRAPLGLGVPIGAGMACVVDNNPINWLTPVISIFLHGGWGHLLGNMLFLWVFGDNVEDAIGPFHYLVFYIVCGVAAAAAHILSGPGSPIPTVGASGAISGVMGAYLLLYPTAKVRMLFFIFVARVQAWIVLVYWFLLQLSQGLAQMDMLNAQSSGGVAVWAHVGGFVAGLVLVKTFEDRPVARPTGDR